MITRLLALLFAASVVVSAQDVSSPPGTSKQQPTDNQTAAKPTNPVPTAINAEPNQATESTGQQRPSGNDPQWYANPDWWQVGLTIVFGIVATLAFLSDRNAVRLTQRADMLMDQIGIHPRPNPCYLTSDTTFSIAFKNFGPTRASNIECETMRFYILGAKEKDVPGKEPPIPPTNTGPGDQYVLTFPKLGIRYDDDSIQEASKGNAPLLFEGAIRYKDVFGKSHLTRCRGRYYGEDGAFITEGEQQAT